MRFYFETLGCRLNEAELQGWRRQVRAAGHAVEVDPVRADVVLLNTCAVTAKASRSSRKRARGLARLNPAANVVLTGCFSSLEGEVAQALEGVDLVVDNSQKDRLVEIVLRELHGEKISAEAMAPAAPFYRDPRRTRGFVKVQDGCRHRCTYCVVTIARGEERSRTPAEVVEECRKLVEAGVTEVVLTGVHIGGYGGDVGSYLSALVEAVLEGSGVERLRLGSLEPWAVDDSLIGLLGESRLMPHLHLPLQSGSDAVLRRMARRCDVEQFSRIVEATRAARPRMNITSDIIVGFPGEREEDHEATVEAVRRLRFGDVHLFSYSSREGTPASRMKGALPGDVIRRRQGELREVVNAERDAGLQRELGRELPVLLERRLDDEGWEWSGLSDTFRRVEVKLAEPGERRREVVRVVPTEISDGNLRGSEIP